jgi:hypothetical protein
VNKSRTKMQIYKTPQFTNSMAGRELGSCKVDLRTNARRRNMRSLIVAGSLGLALLALPAAAEAREYPWCAQYSWSNYNCGFVTFQQCLATISGVGGFCKQNPRYAGPPPRRSRQSRAY